MIHIESWYRESLAADFDRIEAEFFRAVKEGLQAKNQQSWDEIHDRYVQALQRTGQVPPQVRKFERLSKGLPYSDRRWQDLVRAGEDMGHKVGVILTRSWDYLHGMADGIRGRIEGIGLVDASVLTKFEDEFNKWMEVGHDEALKRYQEGVKRLSNFKSKYPNITFEYLNDLNKKATDLWLNSINWNLPHQADNPYETINRILGQATWLYQTTGYVDDESMKFILENADRIERDHARR